MKILNEPWHQDLLLFRKIAIKGASALFIILALATPLAYFFGFTKFSQLLLGGLLGSTLASLNVFVLAYAMYSLVFKKQGLSAIAWPALFFFILSSMAFICVRFNVSLSLGFALGLTAPLLLGTMIAYDSATRLTIAGNKAR